MGISGEKSFSIESNGRLGDPVIEYQSNDSRDLQFSGWGPDVILSRLLFHRLQVGQFTPVLKIVVDVLIVFDGHDFCTSAIQQCDRPTHIHHADGHVEPVQYQHTAIE
jgi:hypothetical protein